MINDLGYHLIVSLLEAFMWDGELEGAENLRAGPGVMVANHLGAIGPVGLCSALPVRVYPWVLGATVDREQGPENVRKDFVEKVLRLQPPLSGWLAQALCQISTPLLLGLGCIPVPSTHAEQEATFSQSISLLKQGKFLLIVPEDSTAEPDHLTGICPFKRGFLRLGELYAQETGRRLPFYPVTIHECGWVRVGKPILYNPAHAAQAERLRMVALLYESIRSMHIEMSANAAAEVLRRKTS